MTETVSTAISRYESWMLEETLQQIRYPTTWFLNTFFAEERYVPASVVEYDVVDADVTLAPFVSPNQPGRPNTRRGHSTRQVQTAYVKMDDLVTPKEGFTRRPGEPYGGMAKTPMQRVDEIVAETVALHKDKLTARMEWMAVSALVSDGYTIQGENQPPVTVSFGRDSTLTLNNGSTAAAWDQNTSNPLQDIETMALRVNILSKGAIVTDLVMTTKTWDLLRANSTVQTLISAFYRNGNSNVDLAPITEAYRPQLVGQFNSRLRVWIYDSYYKDDTGTSQQYLPDFVVLGTCGGSNGIQGRQYFGRIQDLAANLEPLKQHFKSRPRWEPSAMQLVSQSAPLVGPKRPQASFKIIVK